MKPKHRITLLVIVITAILLTFIALRWWAITSYVEPTCRRYAESNSLTYVRYIAVDPIINPSQMVYEGDCYFRTASDELLTVSLLMAGGTSYGAPLLVSLALSWHLVFIASIFVAALILVMLIRVFTDKPAP